MSNVVNPSKIGSAYTGLEHFVYAIMDENNETYGDVKDFGEAMSLKVTPNTSDEKVYTNNGESETASGTNGANVEIGIKDMSPETEANIFGHEIDATDGGIIYKQKDITKYIAFGYIANQNDGTDKYVWLVKVKLTELSKEYQTQGEKKELHTLSTINGSASTRKRDGVWKHPASTSNPLFTEAKQKAFFDKPYELPTVVAVTSVALNKSTTTIVVGSSEELAVTFTPTTATNQKVTWFSTDTSKVIVDQNGKVTAVAIGTATITALTNDGNKTASCIVTAS